MSRTHAHRPWWAQLATPVARHDHRTGPCDLPVDARAQLDADRHGTRTARCRWVPDPHRTPPGCGCAVCTDRASRRADRRRDRHTSRRQLHAGDPDD